MNCAFRILIVPVLLMLTMQVEAGIRWDEPEVVPEKLMRPNRRVIRFSGKTTPNALVRIRKNKLKLYMDSGKTRWASIPQKNKVQFPLTADSDGSFSFNLYLPTIAVEVPVQIKTTKRWRTYSLNFRVPSSGRANDFRAMEESFRATDDKISKIDRNDNYYSRKSDKGLLIRDRDGVKGANNSTVEAWGGLGLSYFDVSIDSTAPGVSINSEGSTLVIPTFRFGVDWDYSKTLMVKGAVRSTSGSTDDIQGGSATVTGKDFTWIEAQAGVVWFSDALKNKRGRLGFDFGFQLQQLPFFRQRQDVINYSYFDNSTYNLHMGLFFQKENARVWNYDIYARYLYTISTGDAFEMNTSFPINFEFGGGVKKRLTQGLSFGVYGQLNYFWMDVKYTNNGLNFENDMSLMLFTVDARLIANF